MVGFFVAPPRTLAAQVAVNSGLFVASSSAKIARTMGAPTNNLKWTMSFFLRKTTTGAVRAITGGVSGISSLYWFDTSDQINFAVSGITVYTTTDTFTNTATFDHIVMQYDSANATQADRFIVHKNGTRCSTSTASVALNQASVVNASGAASNIGYGGFANFSDARDYIDGYISEFYFIDGQTVAPTAFASGTTPIVYAGSYGANGVYLNFQNSGNLGTDSSGLGNNWTNTAVTQSSVVP